jgi:hypothetical protein
MQLFIIEFKFITSIKIVTTQFTQFNSYLTPTIHQSSTYLRAFYYVFVQLLYYIIFLNKDI